MVNIDKWLPLVLLGVASIPEPVARQMISLVLNDFAMKTFAFQRLLSIDVEAGVRDYYFGEQLDENTALLGLMRVQYLHHNSEQFSTPHTNLGWARCGYGQGIQLDPVEHAVLLGSAPSEDHPRGLKITVAVAPTPEAIEVDDVAWTLHSRAIVHGVQERMYSLPQYPWSSLAYARNHAAAYAAAINAAKLTSIMNRMGNTTQPQLSRRGAL